MTIRKLLLLFLNVPLVVMLRFEKPVAKTIWTQHCSKNDVAMNDCNWCRCNMWNTYTCKARACAEVDMLGHFKDSIKEMDLGMEGHGAWRSTDGGDACEAGVRYRKDDLLCICDEDGKWPNPVCRDAFRILHSIVNTTEKGIANNSCSPTKLYLFDCNVCFCPSSGEIDPKLCTTRNCEDEETDNIERTDTKDIVEEVYATCVPHKLYKLGCQTCTCLRNNRLLCDNCTVVVLPTFNWLTGPKTECYLKKPGVTFKKDCNFCHCDSSETIYCTAKKCLKNVSAISLPKLDYDLVELVEEELNCVPQTKYIKDGNTCYCFMYEGAKYFGCSLRKCNGTSASLDTTCVAGTTYQVNCLICHCIVEDGIKSEYCTIDESCVAKEGIEVPRKLSSMHGYCEPMHLYQQDCNKCRCLADGKTVACTSRICPTIEHKRIGRQLSSNMFKSKQTLATVNKPLTVEIVPIVQKGNVCPKGQKYNMVGCNICYCMATGNAICTTKRC